MAKDKKNKKKINPVYSPLTQLQGKTLRRFVKAITNLEYKPQVNAVNQQIGALDTQKQNTTASLGALGTQATGNISSYYRSLAEAEAANAARQQELAQRSQQQTASMTQQAANAVQQAAQNANAQLRQDSGARDELQAMVAEQQSRQAREAQAIQGSNTAQNTNWQGLQQALAASNQTRGSENLVNTQRQSMSDITKATAAFNDEIAAAMARRAGLKGEAAAAFIKNLYQARGAEREFNLGVRALKSKNAYNKTQVKLQKMRNAQQDENNSAQMYIADRYSSAKEYAADRNAEIQALYGQKKDTDRWREAFSHIRGDFGYGGKNAQKAASSKSKRLIIDGLIKKYSFSWGAANKAYSTWLRKYNKKRGYGKGGAFGPASGRRS